MDVERVICLGLNVLLWAAMWALLSYVATELAGVPRPAANFESNGTIRAGISGHRLHQGIEDAVSVILELTRPNQAIDGVR